MSFQSTMIDNPWVFAYGSLIWRPGFSFVGAHKARLFGAHRRLCIYSHRYRGTPEEPGLVFGLLRGGSCHGMAFEVARDDWVAVRAYLEEREQVSGVYKEAQRQVVLEDGRKVRALAFLVDEDHAQYAGKLSVDDEARLVNARIGAAGPNRDYVVNTEQHLSQMGIKDPHLSQVVKRLNEFEPVAFGADNKSA